MHSGQLKWVPKQSWQWMIPCWTQQPLHNSPAWVPGLSLHRSSSIYCWQYTSQSWHRWGYNLVLDQPNLNKIKNLTMGILSSGVTWCLWAGALCSCVVQSWSWSGRSPLWSNKERRVSILLHGGTFSCVVVPKCLLADIVHLGQQHCSCLMVIESLVAESWLVLDG